MRFRQFADAIADIRSTGVNNVVFHLLIFYTVQISVWGYSGNFTDCMITPKWMFCIAGVLVLVIWYTAIRLIGWHGHICVSSIKWYFIVAACTQAFIGIIQKFGVHIFSLAHPDAGCFDNPAGYASCLSISFPFVWFMIFYRLGLIRVVGIVLSGIIVIAVVLSASRSGIISIAAVCVTFLIRVYRRRVMRYMLPLVLVALLVCCYWMKRNSADGRLLVWRCTMEMVSESPLLGYGDNVFEARYMDVQADYFNTRGVENRFAMLADNVKHPFNDYLSLLLTCGVSGLLMVLCGILWICQCYKQFPSLEKRAASYVLFSVCVFSLFSYPFTYPFTWLVVLFCVYLIVRDRVRSLSLGSDLKHVMFIMVLAWSLICVARRCLRFYSEIEWCKASKYVMEGNYRRALPVYRDLLGYFDTNPYFLYNYAAVLQEYGNYNESQKIAFLCCRYWSDYDLELIMGYNAQQLGEFEIAEKHYLKASRMCPSRFLPLYKLLLMYKECGYKSKVVTIAERILSKPIKRTTPAVSLIRREAEIARTEITNTLDE